MVSWPDDSSIMRILHIIDSGGMYGAEVMLLNLVAEQVRLGLYPVIASIGNNGTGEKEIEREARRLKFAVQQFRMAPGPNFCGAMKIIRFAQVNNIDALHSHGYKGNILLGFMPQRIRKIPLVTTVHGWTSTAGFSKMRIYEWLDSVSLSFMDAVVLVNKSMLCHPLFKGHLSGNVHIIDNGIASKAPASPPLRDDIKSFCQGNRVIGAIGRLSAEKGFSYLLDAFSVMRKKRDDVRLLILGEGPLRQVLEQKISELGIGDVVFMPGFVSGASSYLSLFDVLAMPSISEGLPITLLEAMREGVPAVASAVGGIPKALDGGRCGLLIPPCDQSLLMKALSKMLSPGLLARSLSVKGKVHFVTHYTSTRMCEQYVKLYRELLAD